MKLAKVLRVQRLRHTCVILRVEEKRDGIARLGSDI
jgi:hypothetical protein